MPESIAIEPMQENFLLWRCLQFGPLSPGDIDQPPDNVDLAWERYRERNMPLLKKFTQTYGACAIVAREKDRVVGMIRFYPKAVWDFDGECCLCLQQDYPAGPADDLVASEFPPLERIEEKTLAVHCLSAGQPGQEKNPHQRQGLATRMVETLIEWARFNGWETIEASAFEDLPIIYTVTGSAGQTFWKKLGFRVTKRFPHPALQEPSEFTDTLEQQAESAGVDPEKAKDQINMRLDLI